MRRANPTHNLRVNHAEWCPPAVVYLDTETATTRRDGSELLTLRLWAARLIDRRPTHAGRQDDLRADGDTADQLAEQIEAWTVGRPTLWVYCHNLSFDLTTTRLPLLLADRGWSITEAAVDGRSPWMRLANGRKRITLADSWSWLPAALESIGRAVHVDKPALPDDADDRATWLHRCQADVDILATAVGQLMGWWEANKLGNWSITGAACGWNAYRHRPSVDTITVVTDPAGITHDRKACYGGRRQTWVHGPVTEGPFAELDFIAAYPTIASAVPLPRKRSVPLTAAHDLGFLLDSPRWGVVADVRITSNRARFPVRVGKRTWYPTGTFTTTLAGPDLADAMEAGEIDAVLGGYVHKLGYNMRAWGQWVLHCQDDDSGDTPPAARLACKSWGRTVIGKWGAHGYTRTKLGPAPQPGWHYTPGWDHQAQCKGSLLDLAGTRFWCAAADDAENAYPAITAWVEAAVRQRLSIAIDTIGEGAVVQANTDGLIVNLSRLGHKAAGGAYTARPTLPPTVRMQAVLDAINGCTQPLVMRCKTTTDHIQVIGPQHLDFGTERRYSGVPRSAAQVAAGRFETLAWPQLRWQMEAGEAAGYVRPRQLSVVTGPFASGWILTTGQVVPPTAYVDRTGVTRLAPWVDLRTVHYAATLADQQNPELLRTVTHTSDPTPEWAESVTL